MHNALTPHPLLGSSAVLPSYSPRLDQSTRNEMVDRPSKDKGEELADHAGAADFEQLKEALTVRLRALHALSLSTETLLGLSKGNAVQQGAKLVNRQTTKVIKRTLRLWNAFNKVNILDPLTGLKNRQTFTTDFKAMLNQAVTQHRPMGIILIDADHFKHINDTHGHPMGDLVLQRIAATLKNEARDVYRYGGEEFMILLPNCKPKRIREVNEKLLEAVPNQPKQRGEDSLFNLFGLDSQTAERNLSLSMSTAYYDGDEALAESFHDPDALLEFVDKGLYFAKQNGRNQAVIYDLNTLPVASQPQEILHGPQAVKLPVKH